jgi:hypothetical protein
VNDDLFSFPQIPSPQRVALLRSRPLDVDPFQLAGRFAERFRMKGKVLDAGARLLVRDELSSLEIFVASGSVRWSAWPGKPSEAASEPRLPDESSAVERAERWLRDVGLDHKSARVHSVTNLELSFRRADERLETTWAIARQVNLHFEQAGLPFFGPGAKTQVSLGDGGEPVETLRFWREVDVVADALTIQPDDVIDIVRRDPTFAELRPGESYVKFLDCRLGYYALPPREMQGVIVPVFALSGTASTPALPRYDFTRYVPAVPLPEKGRGRSSNQVRAVSAF